ncbi:hypothetical protein CMEL01_16660 [Colletotrichum melonis]|uniref:Uncharacterized protein n=1 Tax=Colletotrichum melonis TaxID=1209925 RepID=A0AAI9UA19_9PEZI|nr:hypothetical protein CMEL01_16660 [Colletotrichum melonis]
MAKTSPVFVTAGSGNNEPKDKSTHQSLRPSRSIIFDTSDEETDTKKLARDHLCVGYENKFDGPPPDGGVKAWTQALMAHFVVFNTWEQSTLSAFFKHSIEIIFLGRLLKLAGLVPCKSFFFSSLVYLPGVSPMLDIFEQSLPQDLRWWYWEA